MTRTLWEVVTAAAVFAWLWLLLSTLTLLALFWLRDLARASVRLVRFVWY